MKVLINGAEPDEAKIIVLLLHGRGADGDDILGLSTEFEDEDICWLAPTAMNNAWYPGKIGDRRAASEPFLTLSTEQLKGLIAEFPDKPFILGGFSQGACMSAELLARHELPLSAIWVFSGGFIGADDELPLVGDELKDIPVLISGSREDPHIPLQRMEKTAAHFEERGALVEVFHYDVPGHQIAVEEIELAKASLLKVREQI